MCARLNVATRHTIILRAVENIAFSDSTYFAVVVEPFGLYCTVKKAFFTEAYNIVNFHTASFRLQQSAIKLRYDAVRVGSSNYCCGKQLSIDSYKPFVRKRINYIITLVFVETKNLAKSEFVFQIEVSNLLLVT